MSSSSSVRIGVSSIDLLILKSCSLLRFIEARRELNLPLSTVFPRPEIAIPAFIDTQAEVWDALNAGE